MTIVLIRNALLYCTVINFALLWLWALLYLLPHEWWYRATSRMFRISAERLDTISLAGILFYKICILFFNLVPYLALCIVG